AGAEYVVMAGYMRMLGEEVLDAFPDKVINLHPALLPSFTGAHAISDAFEAGVKVTGITVHFANAEYDKGPIIAQRALDVREDDTLESLEARIHEVEHKLYPEVLRLVADRRVSIDEKRKVRISE
ncbi:MAG: formyltransferase family protein, partial [Raoultibacter sp.]